MVKNIFLSLLLSFGFIFGSFAEARPHKIVIFTASFGQGHNTAAKVMAKRLQAEDPTLEIKIQDISEFATSKRFDKYQHDHYNDVTQNKPWLFKLEFFLLMWQARLFNGFGFYNLLTDTSKMQAFLEREKPDLIASTYFFATSSVISLREEGKISEKIPLVWTHTDYVDEKFFFKHAAKSDMTFVPSQPIMDSWIKKGIDPPKLLASGMLVSDDVLIEMSELEKRQYLESKGLRPDVPVVAIAGGGEGMVDYEAIIKSIGRSYSGPVQIVVLAGKNEEKRRAVEALVLRSNMTLKAEGFIPNIEIIKYAKSAQVYITKPGGFSSTEAVASRARSVFVNIMGAQEGRNAKYFEQAGMALVTDDQDKVGEKVALILNNPSVGDSLYEKSGAMAANIQGHLVNKFVFRALADEDSRVGAWDARECGDVLSLRARFLSLF